MQNVAKTKVQRKFANQLWVGTFWESLANYPSKNFNYDFTLSYSPAATFPNFAMIRDTLSSPEQLKVPLSFEKKKSNNLASMWISNCNSKNR